MPMNIYIQNNKKKNNSRYDITPKIFDRQFLRFQTKNSGKFETRNKDLSYCIIYNKYYKYIIDKALLYKSGNALSLLRDINVIFKYEFNHLYYIG